MASVVVAAAWEVHSALPVEPRSPNRALKTTTDQLTKTSDAFYVLVEKFVSLKFLAAASPPSEVQQQQAISPHVELFDRQT